MFDRRTALAAQIMLSMLALPQVASRKNDMLTTPVFKRGWGRKRGDPIGVKIHRISTMSVDSQLRQVEAAKLKRARKDQKRARNYETSLFYNYFVSNHQRA